MLLSQSTVGNGGGRQARGEEHGADERSTKRGFVGTLSEGAWWREVVSRCSLHHLSSAAILSQAVA